MSGRFRGVIVHKRMNRRCPSCQAPSRPHTDDQGDTVIDYAACRPETCRRKFREVWNSAPYHRSFEPLPVDDRRSSRARYPGSAA